MFALSNTYASSPQFCSRTHPPNFNVDREFVGIVSRNPEAKYDVGQFRHPFDDLYRSFQTEATCLRVVRPLRQEEFIPSAPYAWRVDFVQEALYLCRAIPPIDIFSIYTGIYKTANRTVKSVC